MEETAVAVLEVPAKKKRGRPKKQTATWVEGGVVVTEPIDFDNFASKKAKENQPKEVKLEDANFTKYIGIGGVYYKPKNCVVFKNDEVELVVYQNGVIEICEMMTTRLPLAFSARTPEQIEALVKGFGVGK